MSITYHDLATLSCSELPLNVVVVASTVSIQNISALQSTGVFGGDALDLVSAVAATLVV
jgi:hypothetical protein